ncbi:MAG: phosphatidylserine decarboxylase family protein [bacterium]
MIAKYGIDNFIVMLILGVIIIIFGVLLNKPYSYFVVSLGSLLILFAIWFFRDPERIPPKEITEDSSILLSPADGKVIEITEIVEPNYLKTKVLRISIFLSPLDVHVNRSPASGEVEYFKYYPGKYLIASHPKASDLNENSQIGLIMANGQKILFKQITGYVARRLVCEVKVGMHLTAGEKFGMMKFGSRMDIFVPLTSELYIKVGDRVRAGEQIIGKVR